MSALLAVCLGIALLVWSAERFVEGAACTARHLRMPPLLIGMVIIGFGTSAPEMVLSTLAAAQGNPGLALGNAYGSNITNIALVLGFTALVRPVPLHSQVLRKELPLLLVITALAAWQLRDGEVSRLDAWVLLTGFIGLMSWTIRQGMRQPADALAREVDRELFAHRMSLHRALVWLVVGLLLLIVSSRLLVWGAVEIARYLGVSDLLIGLTVVAIGTSLPELVAALVATRKGEHDIALGNVMGSNLFNTLAVVGLAGVIQPIEVGVEVFYRDLPVMAAMTLALCLFGYGWHDPGRINRYEGAALLAGYVGYNGYLISLIAS